jgi:glyoxylase-like metal-dependent hydrolase (beta-lactamase superfamily II)
MHAAASGTPDHGPDEHELLAAHDVLRLRADNPGALTLTGTNTWIVGRSPAWVIDPGPLLEDHLRRMFDAIELRGGLGGVAVTHDHRDHAEALEAVRDRYRVPVAAGRGAVDVALTTGSRFGPLQAVATPGHAPDHFAFVANGACFTGDAVLGEGSVFIAPDPGAMSGYLLGLTNLRLRKDFTVLCPGHGEPVWEAEEKLDEYIAHRMERQDLLIATLGGGGRSIAELLAGAWPEVPEYLHPLAEATLAAHLD